MKFVPGTPLGEFRRMSLASGLSFDGHVASSHGTHWLPYLPVSGSGSEQLSGSGQALCIDGGAPFVLFGHPFFVMPPVLFGSGAKQHRRVSGSTAAPVSGSTVR